MANPDSVPAGKYGKAALENAWCVVGVEKQVARAENVRAALALVSRGEAPFGIVYATDALADKGVRVVDAFPAGQPSAHHLSGGADCGQQVARRETRCSSTCALPRRAASGRNTASDWCSRRCSDSVRTRLESSR